MVGHLVGIGFTYSQMLSFSLFNLSCLSRGAELCSVGGTTLWKGIKIDLNAHSHQRLSDTSVKLLLRAQSSDSLD